jgi:hypothetical protein
MPAQAEERLQLEVVSYTHVPGLRDES